MRRKILQASTLILLLAVALAAAATGQVTEKTLTVTDKAYLHVKTVSGDIQVTGWAKSGEVYVKATIDGKNVKPVIEQKDGQIYLSELHDNPGFFGGSSGSVHFTVFVPAAAVVEGKSVSGTVKLEKLAGPVDFKTVSGDIALSLTGASDCDLSAVSGNITVQADAFYNAALSAKSISGGVDLVFSRGADARLRTSSISGEIDCKLKLEDAESKKGYGSTGLAGRIGSGTGRIELSTISGDITVR